MVLLALPPADHLLIERDRGQFVPSRRRRMMANARAERLLKSRRAYPRRCNSNASGLHGRNSARILGIRASFQRDNLRRHFGVRVLSRQPRSPVSEYRHSGGAMIVAGPADTNDKAASRRCGAHLPEWRNRWATSRMHALVLRLNRRLGPLRGCRFFNALQIRGQGRALQVFFLWAFGVDRR